MFTKEDYKNYFNELEDILKKTIAIYTDSINELEDETISSKLDVLATENMEFFRFIRRYKERF